MDLTELLIFFDELLPLTNEEQGIYWFKTQREDGLIITLVCSLYEAHVSVSVDTIRVTTASLSLKSCSEIRILDQKRKCLEILHENGRCFLSLLGSPILEYDRDNIQTIYE